MLLFLIFLPFLSCDKEKIVYRSTQNPEPGLIQGTWAKIQDSDTPPTLTNWSELTFSGSNCTLKNTAQSFNFIGTFTITGRNLKIVGLIEGTAEEVNLIYDIFGIDDTTLVLENGDIYSTYKKI